MEEDKPENTVFEGGGVKALAYPGALLVLEQVGWLQGVIRHLGTSAGSFTAMMLALGYSPTEIAQFSLNTDFTQFEDGWFAINIWHEFEDYGYYTGDDIFKELQKLVEQKLGNPNATFADLAEHTKTDPSLKALYVVTTNFSRRKTAVMSNESDEYRNVPIALAVRASMAFPILFEPVHMENKKDKRIDLHIDGGLYRNFYLTAFDKKKYISSKLPGSENDVFNPKTLGLRLDSTNDYKQYELGEDIYFPINSFTSDLSTLCADVLNEQKTLYRDKTNEKRIIGINVENVGTADFSIDKSTRLKLMHNGAKAAARHLEAMGIKVDLQAVDQIIDGLDAQAVVLSQQAQANVESEQPFIMSQQISATASQNNTTLVEDKSSIITYLWQLLQGQPTPNVVTDPMQKIRVAPDNIM